jgi:hypothetical protein
MAEPSAIGHEFRHFQRDYLRHWAQSKNQNPPSGSLFPRALIGAEIGKARQSQQDQRKDVLLISSYGNYQARPEECLARIAGDAFQLKALWLGHPIIGKVWKALTVPKTFSSMTLKDWKDTGLTTDNLRVAKEMTRLTLRMQKNHRLMQVSRLRHNYKSLDDVSVLHQMDKLLQSFIQLDARQPKSVQQELQPAYQWLQHWMEYQPELLKTYQGLDRVQ